MFRIQRSLWMLMFCALAVIDACASRESAKDGESTRDGAADGGDATELAVEDAEGADGTDGTESETVGDSEASPTTAFLGDWTLRGTSMQRCPTRSLDNNDCAVPVSFLLGSEDDDRGEADFFYDPGLGCSLPMEVSGNEAVLRSAPVLCQPLGSPGEVQFNSVQVTLTGSVLTVVEKVTAASCTWLVQGTLGR